MDTHSQREEYLVLTVMGIEVQTISPSNPQTETTRTGSADYGHLASVLNKLAEYGYQLLPFSVRTEDVRYATLVMRRERSNQPDEGRHR